jgi:3-deoxy-D-manno-octulosonic-acid transferase
MAAAAAPGKCTIFGRYTFNFNQTVDCLLKDSGAIQVENEQELLVVIQKCLNEPDYALKIAQNGQNVIRKNQGATKRTVEQIKMLLKIGAF